MQNLSSPVGTTGWFQGNSTVFPAQAGAATSYIGANFNNTTGANTISNWLLTPTVTLQNGATLKFWTRTVDAPQFSDRLQVRMSTAGASTNVGATPTSVGDFTTLMLDINPTYVPTVYPNVWTQFTVTVSGVASPTQGRLAFRYFVENGGPTGANSDYIGIDSVQFSGVCGPTPTPTATPTGTLTPTATPTATPTPGLTLVAFSSPTYTDDESQTASIGLVRSGITTGTSTVTFATSNGTATGGAACTAGVDYISVSQVVTFAPGETNKTVNVILCGDGLDETNLETVNLTLTGPDTRGEAPEVQTAVLRINDTATSYRNIGNICTNVGGPTTPYPSTITVAGGPTQIGGVRVTLYDFWHQLPDNIDVLLVGPGGQKFVLMGDAGGALPIDQANPVTLTLQDVQPAVLPNNGPLLTGTFEPTTWESPVTSFPAPAPPAPYNEPGSAVGGSGTQTLAGTFGLTNANGVWSLYVRDDAGLTPSAISGCLDGGWGLEFVAPTAAQASISGRVTTADGLGIRNAEMVLTGNSLTEPMRVTTSSFGYFSFEGLATGETYVLTVNSRRFTFQAPSQVISLVDNAAEINFTAEQ